MPRFVADLHGVQKAQVLRARELDVEHPLALAHSQVPRARQDSDRQQQFFLQHDFGRTNSVAGEIVVVGNSSPITEFDWEDALEQRPGPVQRHRA